MAEKSVNTKHNLIMELYLDVTTVETVDTSTLRPHTAYTVCMSSGENLKLASAWTLRDALDLFSKVYGFEKDSLRIKRPFRPQRNPKRHI